VRRTNIFAPQFDQSSDRPGYSWRSTRIAATIAAAQIGGCIYELPDGERTWPFHYHHGTEEWLIVVDGTPTLRDAEGEQVLRAGDVVCFSTGPGGAHQLRGPGTVLMLSATHAPEAVEYPDSGKVGVRPPGGIFRKEDAVDYWEGE
jgi:uncharacterized cupin superfamily protein